METGRLEAFYDAIIAIIVTILVLELPQPASASLAAIWAIKTSYFAYLISFLVCVNLWQYHHLIYQHVERIDAKVIWLNIILMFVFSLIPYLTIFTANHPNSLLTQSLYGLDFIIINIILFLMAKYLIKINSDNEYLKHAINLKNAVYISINNIYSGVNHCIFRLSCCNKYMLFDYNCPFDYCLIKILGEVHGYFIVIIFTIYYRIRCIFNCCRHWHCGN